MRVGFTKTMVLKAYRTGAQKNGALSIDRLLHHKNHCVFYPLSIKEKENVS